MHFLIWFSTTDMQTLQICHQYMPHVKFKYYWPSEKNIYRKSNFVQLKQPLGYNVTAFNPIWFLPVESMETKDLQEEDLCHQ
jgi:hypothetical protein